MAIVPPWSTIRRVGNSYVARLSIVVPFLGYWILLQEGAVKFFSWPAALQDHKTVALVPDMSFYLLYFGLFIFGCGSLIYEIACSNIVKKYEDEEAYVRGAFEYTTIDMVREKLKTVSTSRAVSQEMQLRAEFFLEGLESHQSLEYQKDAAIFALNESYKTIDVSLFGWRALSFGLLVLGSVLVFAPSLLMLCRVVAVFAQRFIGLD